MNLSSHSTTLKRIKTLEIPMNFDESRLNYVRPPIKLPSGNFSIFKKGSELELRPSSPYRYSSTSSRDFKSPNYTQHSRSSTTSPGLSKFIPATELISFEDAQTPAGEDLNSEIPDELDSSLSFEEELKQRIVYPSLCNNRDSFLASTVDFIFPSTMSTPQDPRISSINPMNNAISHEKDSACKKSTQELDFFQHSRSRNDKSVIVRKIYCDKCQENVTTSFRYKKVSQNM